MNSAVSLGVYGKSWVDLYLIKKTGNRSNPNMICAGPRSTYTFFVGM